MIRYQPKPIQVLKNITANGSILIDDGADRLQFLALGMIKNVVHQRHLFLPFFAHFEVGSFSVYVVITVAWTLPIYYNERENATEKCAYFR